MARRHVVIYHLKAPDFSSGIMLGPKKPFAHSAVISFMVASSVKLG
jgi:hypothetical protein